MRRPPAVAFAKLLEDVPFTDEELGRAIGRSRATVHRWRHGDSSPSWGDMEKAADVIDRRLLATQEKLRRVREACEMYKRATALTAALEPEADGGYDGGG